MSQISWVSVCRVSALALLTACSTPTGSPTVTTVIISPLHSTIVVGKSQAFTALAGYSDGSSKDVTTLAAWSTGDSSIAAVDSGTPGHVGGVSTGTTTVSVTFNSKRASAEITVETSEPDAGPQGPTVLGISVAPSTAQLAVGATLVLSATGAFGDGTAGLIQSGVTWSTGDMTVATVDSTGVVTGVAPGSTTATATVGTVTGSATITVVVPSMVVTALTIQPRPASLSAGANQQLTATATYEDGSTGAVTSSVSWSSSHVAVATVSQGGLVTALAPGSTTISASIGRISSSFSLAVSSATPTLQSIALSPASPSLSVGFSVALAVTGTYSDQSMNGIDSTAVTWTSDNTAVATVSPAGVILGVAAGSTQIAALYDGQTAMVAVTVQSSAPALQSIAVAPDNVAIEVGHLEQLSATGNYADGSMKALSTGVSWATADTTVATVNSSGLLTAVAAGSTTVTATDGAATSAAIPVVVASGGQGSCHPVINEVQPGVLHSATNEFIELYNPCTSSVDVTGWVVYYRAASGTSDHALVTLSGPLAAASFVVLGYKDSAGAGYSGTTDYTYRATSLSGTSGGVRLAMAGVGSAMGAVVDSMSYGASNAYTSGSPAPYAGDTTPASSVARTTDGANTGDNSVDFAETSMPTPGAANRITH